MADWMTRWNEFQKSAEPCFRYLKAEDLIHATHISLQNKYLYVETAKVACSTVKKILIEAEYEGKVPILELDYVHYREFSPLLNARQVGDFKQFLARKDFFKFCFVRNPYSRLLSCYLDKIKQRKGQHQPLLVELGYGPFSERTLTFKEFVEGVIAQPTRYMDPHWRIQYYATFQDGISYDFIGKFENFEQDLSFAINQTNINFEKYYTIVNRHATKANNLLQTYYTKDLQKKVYQKFKIDFDYFGYSVELEFNKE